MAAAISPPSSTARAAVCLWASSGLALLATLVQVAGIVPMASGTAGMTAAIGTITAALLAFIAAKVSAGRGWVRWVFLAVYLLGTPLSVLVILSAPATFSALPGILQLNSAAQTVLQTAALVLMFTPASRAWFRSIHVHTAP